ncbi:MAG: T9SS type A sorting domain-containing protein [Bacteroidetes bacterium]|nr:T9SS type A sorting domain-containing protein [Bacteroidota bacterium]
MKKIFTLFFTISFGLSAMAQLITATGNMSVQRVGHESQLLSNGKVLVFGGNNGNFTGYTVHSSAQLYSGGSWATTGSMMKARSEPGSALLTNGNVLVIGGEDLNSNSLKSCEIYNVTSGMWSYTDSMANARSETRAVILNSGKILAVGGSSGGTCELYDQTSSTWSVTGSMKVARSAGFAATKLPNGDVLVTGGQSDTAEIYNVTSGTWNKVSNLMTLSRNYCTAILMTNGKILIAGGTSTFTSEVYDPSANTFTATGNLGQYRVADEMINLTNGKVLIYGIGTFAADRLALEVFNPATNSWYYAGTVSSAIFTASDYTVHKLPGGSILYSGGNWTTGNGANKECYLVNESAIAAGIAEALNLSFFEVYPNPVHDNFEIKMEIDGAVNITIELKNMLGQTIKIIEKGKVSGSYHKAEDISDLNSGIYILHVITGNANAAIKLVKE